MANRSIASRKSLSEGQSAFPQRSCLAGRGALRTRLTLTSPTAAGLQQRLDLGERPETSPSTDSWACGPLICDRGSDRSLVGEFLYVQGGVTGGTWNWGMVGRVN